MFQWSSFFKYHAACSAGYEPEEEFLPDQEGQQLFSKTYLPHLFKIEPLQFWKKQKHIKQ